MTLGEWCDGGLLKEFSAQDAIKPFINNELAMELRTYQTTAVEWLASRKRGMVVAAAGSGKTWIIAAAIQRVVDAKPRERPARVLWLANTKEQVQQAKAALSAFPPNGQLQVTVACVAGVKPEDATHFDLVFFDEAHYLRRAARWQAIAAAAPNALWGCTATPWGENDDENLALCALFGGHVHQIERSATASNITPVEVVWLPSPAPHRADRLDAEIAEMFAWHGKRWAGCRKKLYAVCAWRVIQKRGIWENSGRTAALVAAAKSHRGAQVLILVPTVSFGNEIAKITNGELANSKMPAKQRARVLKDFAAGRLSTLIATSLADEGLDLPNAEILIQCSGGKSAARTEQRAGRVMRTFEGKERGLIYDMNDDWHPLALRHAKSRAATYARIGATFRDRL